MTTNKDLDRLLELQSLHWIRHFSFSGKLTELEEKERQSLKSELESKLVQADRFKYLQEDDYIRNQYVLPLIKTGEELSQLRPIVRALRDEENKLQKQKNYEDLRGDDFDHTTSEKLELIKSILASSEVK